MRKSFNGLGEQLYNLDEDPFSGHLFIFRKRRGDTVKILWADADGLCLFSNAWNRTVVGLLYRDKKYPLNFIP
jgi:transposase